MSGLLFRELGSTPPPRISKSIYNLNPRVLLFSDLLALFSLPRTISTVVANVARNPHFIPSPPSAVRVLYLVCVLYPVHILYPVRSPQSAVHSPCFTLTNYHSISSTVLTHAPSIHRLNRQAKNIFLSYESLVIDLIGQLS